MAATEKFSSFPVRDRRRAALATHGVPAQILIDDGKAIRREHGIEQVDSTAFADHDGQDRATTSEFAC